MPILNVGVSYRTAATEFLEQLAIPPAALVDALTELHAVPVVSEALLLSTCNRVEIFVETASTSAGAHSAARFLAGRAGLPVEQVCRSMQLREEAAAVAHLCAVASGLESMAVGEEQIVAQLRFALRAARSANAAGPVLTGLVDAALRASKRVRTETDIGAAASSLVGAGLDLAREFLGGFSGRSALLIGSGAMSALAGRSLREQGIGEILVHGRSRSRAARLAAAVGGTALEPDAFSAGLTACQLLVAATAAPGAVVTASDLRAARSRSGLRPMFCLDLAMPRDVEPRCAEIPGVTLVDIEALGRQLALRQPATGVDRAREIVAEEVAAYARVRRTAVAAPLVTALRSKALGVAERELGRLYQRLPALGRRERAETAATVHRIVDKLLHTPTVRAKELSADPDGGRYVEAISRLFDLDSGDSSGSSDSSEVSAR
jgi:glutamyl-tRNA reductase